MEKNNTFKLTAVTAGATLKPGNQKPEIVLLYYLAVYKRSLNLVDIC